MWLEPEILHSDDREVEEDRFEKEAEESLSFGNSESILITQLQTDCDAAWPSAGHSLPPPRCRGFE